MSGGVETQILVARDERVKVNDAYRDRAGMLNYTSSPEDLSLWLGDLRSSDSGYYRCEMQHGLEDASDIVQLKVKGETVLLPTNGHVSKVSEAGSEMGQFKYKNDSFISLYIIVLPLLY